MLNIQKTTENGTALFTLEGRLDTITSPTLEKLLRESLDGVSTLILDLQGLEYISSAGLRVFLSAQKLMNKQGTMEIHHVNESIMEIFEVTGFTEILTIK